MTVFFSTLEQTAFLFSFLLLGFLLSRGKFVPDNTATALSRLESYVFIPALVLGTFTEQFTPQKLKQYGSLLLFSLGLLFLSILITYVLAPLCSRDPYEKRIYSYGLVFSNFGFMGNAVVGALFPDIFLEYIIFTLPLWTGIYLWGAPVLLIGSDGEKKSFFSRLKSFCNPMFVCTLIGMVIGITGFQLPAFLNSALTSAGNCMSPVAMLLTGMTIAQFKFRDVLCIKGVYIVTAMRLVLLPALFLVVSRFVPMPKTEAVCTLAALSMPLGLNSIIIPSAYGRDTRVASGMALVSHVLSCLTIPLIFLLYEIL